MIKPLLGYEMRSLIGVPWVISCVVFVKVNCVGVRGPKILSLSDNRSFPISLNSTGGIFAVLVAMVSFPAISVTVTDLPVIRSSGNARRER